MLGAIVNSTPAMSDRPRKQNTLQPRTGFEDVSGRHSVIWVGSSDGMPRHRRHRRRRILASSPDQLAKQVQLHDTFLALRLRRDDRRLRPVSP
jgi:hypothetical protein